jgi:hypothetical protein
MTVASEPRSWPRAFASSGVEIFDARLPDHGEVTLWSTGGPAPQRGDLFSLEHGHAVHDLSVVEVKVHDPGWSALCRRVDIAWR